MRIAVVVFVIVILHTLASGAMSQEMIDVLASSPDSPISTSSGVLASLQCTKNSDESYAVCASYSNIAIKYNLQPFSFAAKGPNQGYYMISCDLYETDSESKSRAVCAKNGYPAVVYFHRVSDMIDVTNVTMGPTSSQVNYDYLHVIVDTPNQIAYISDFKHPPAIHKITNIGSSTPTVAATLTSFGSGDYYPAAMLIIDGFLYVHFAMEPAARLARINISTFKWNQTVSFASGENHGQNDNLANDDTFVYDLTDKGILVRCTYNDNYFARFDSLNTGLSNTYSLAISPDFSFLLLAAYSSGIVVVNTSTFFIDGRALLPNPTSPDYYYASAVGRPIILSKNSFNGYPVCAFSSDNDYLYIFNFAHVPFREAYPIIYPLPSSPTNTSSGVSGSLQCTKNSDESYAVCASISNTAIKYNLQPFSFAAKGPNQGDFMNSCDLYETSSQSTSRAVCAKGSYGADGIVYFHRVSDMINITNVTIGITSEYPHVIVDTPNQVAYISNFFYNPPAIYKITNIGSSTPIVAATLPYFGSGDTSPAAMLIIDGFLYVQFDMGLARVKIATFTWKQTISFSERGYEYYDNLANDDNFIYDLTQNGWLFRCTYINDNFARFDSLSTGLSDTNSLAISPDHTTLFVMSRANDILINGALQLIDVTSFAMFGNMINVPSAIGRPIITSSRYVYAFSGTGDAVYEYRYTNPTKTHSTSLQLTGSTSSSNPTSTRSTTKLNVPSRTRAPTKSPSSQVTNSASKIASASSSITKSLSSAKSQSASMSISSSISVSETITTTDSETIASCIKIFNEYKCNASHCQWCHDLGACVRPTDECSAVHCTSFTARGYCPFPGCQICDGICVVNNTEYAGDRCSVKYFDQTTCEGCHNCTWNEKVLAGVNDAQPYCVMSQNASSCPSPLTCSSINLPGFDHENQCLAAGCKYDHLKKECVNLRCFSFFLNSWIIQPIGLLIIGFLKDVAVLLLFGVFGDVVLKILKAKLLVPFKFWKNKWDKNKIKVNLERTIYVNDSKARDFTSDKSESFEQYCEKIADKFFELPETNDEEIRKDWKRRIVDAVTFAMFDTGLWFDLDNDGYGKLDEEKEPKKLNGVEALIMNDDNDEKNEKQEIQRHHFTPRETQLRDENDAEFLQQVEKFRKLQERYEKTQEQLQFYRDNASREVIQRFNDQFTNDSKQRKVTKKLFIPRANLLSRHMLQQIVTDEITEHATCVVYYASSRVTSIRAATALNSFPSPLQLFYYLLGIIFLVSSSFASVLSDENQAVISRIASYSCTSSNSTSSASGDAGVFRSTFMLLGFRLMNASTVATVFLVLVKTVRAIWASYGGRFNQLQLPQRLPIMGLYTKRTTKILLGFYFGVVLIFALVGFFYGFKLTASLKVIGITLTLLVGDALLLWLIRFLTSRFQEKDLEKQNKEIKVEEEELASRTDLRITAEKEQRLLAADDEFDEITVEEVIDVKKQSLTNSAPTSLPEALLVFLLSEEFPTILLTISLQLCYNYMCLVEYKSSFGFTDESMSEISTKEYESRSMDCIWELFQNDVSGYANALSSFVAFL